MLANSIKNQTQRIFLSIEILLESIPENEFNTIKGGFLTWKHFYHLIYTLDKYFIDPSNFNDPLFHNKNMCITNMDNDNILSKNEIKEYYNNVKTKTQDYINKLDDKILEEKIPLDGMEFTKLELILGQLRHSFYHIGYFHCCIKMEKGEAPEYMY